MRRIVVHGVLIAFPLLAAIDIAAGIESWPFSQYPMYEGVQGRSYAMMKLYGVSSTGEFAIPAAAFAPFLDGRMASSMARFQGAAFDRAAAECMRLYQHNREIGRYTGPPISGIKLYDLTWDLDKSPAPVSKILIAESH